MFAIHTGLFSVQNSHPNEFNAALLLSICYFASWIFLPLNQTFER
jgi:hypothetical protein